MSSVVNSKIVICLSKLNDKYFTIIITNSFPLNLFFVKFIKIKEYNQLY